MSLHARVHPPSPGAAIALLALSTGLLACPPERGGGDDDDAAGGDFGGLDRNSDGVLDAEDVEAGAAAMFITFDFEADGETGQEPGDEALESTSVSLYPGFEAWTLDATFPSATPDLTFNISLRFVNLGTEFPGIGAGAVTTGSMSPSSQTWYAWRNEPGGEVDITESSPSEASGSFVGEATLDVLGQFEEPTGETVVVHGFAFHDAPLQVNVPGQDGDTGTD